MLTCWVEGRKELAKAVYMACYQYYGLQCTGEQVFILLSPACSYMVYYNNYYIHVWSFTATAKIVYGADIQVFYNYNEEAEEFMGAITLLFDCMFKLLTEPPFFKLYPNKVYHDVKKGFTVSLYAI